MPCCLDWPPPQAKQPRSRQVLAKSDVGVGYSPTTSMAHEGSCSRPSPAKNPALEALSRAAAAVILLLPLSQLHLLSVEVQHPGARRILSHPREGGRVEWRKERPHLKAPAPPPPPERLRVPGALTPYGSSPHRRVPSAPRPWWPSALTALSWGRSAGPGARGSQPSAPQRAVGTLASHPSRSFPHRSGCGRGGCRAPCRWGKSPGGSRCGSRAGGAAGSPSGGRSLWANRAVASPRSGPGARSGNPGSQLRACSPEMRKSRADPSPRWRRPPPPPPWRGARGRAGAEVRELPLPAAGVGDSPALARSLAPRSAELQSTSVLVQGTSQRRGAWGSALLTLLSVKVLLSLHIHLLRPLIAGFVELSDTNCTLYTYPLPLH